MKRSALVVLVFGAFWLRADSVGAQVIAETAPPPFPDPKKFSKGFFIQGELGALAFVGNRSKHLAPGPMFAIRLGYDITRWLAVEARAFGAASDVTLPPPQVGQVMQTYVYNAEAKFSVGIRRFRLALQAGAGLGQWSSNALDRVGVTNGNLFSFAVTGGVGVDYHTLNRHFSLGVNVDYAWLQKFSNTHAIGTTAYLKYTH